MKNMTQVELEIMNESLFGHIKELREKLKLAEARIVELDSRILLLKDGLQTILDGQAEDDHLHACHVLDRYAVMTEHPSNEKFKSVYDVS